MGPTNLQEAQQYRYREWAGSPKGIKYDPAFCATEVPDRGRSVLSHQCCQKPGHGPDKIFCTQHAKRFTKQGEQNVRS